MDRLRILVGALASSSNAIASGWTRPPWYLAMTLDNTAAKSLAFRTSIGDKPDGLDIEWVTASMSKSSACISLRATSSNRRKSPEVTSPANRARRKRPFVSTPGSSPTFKSRESPESSMVIPIRDDLRIPEALARFASSTRGSSSELTKTQCVTGTGCGAGTPVSPSWIYSTSSPSSASRRARTSQTGRSVCGSSTMASMPSPLSSLMMRGLYLGTAPRALRMSP